MPPPQVNRAVLGELRGCQSDYGGICMNTCVNRQTCRINKTPFLIQARSHKIKPERPATINGVPVVLFEVLESHPDEYINELTGAELGRMGKSG